MSGLQLPDAFRQEVTAQLGSAEGEKFLQSYEQPRAYGLRINPLKCAPDSPLFEEMKRLFHLRPVPWCTTGYYYNEDTRPGRHIYHSAGAYYIQEPSAMSAVELLAPQPGEVILDLAAAPGGKTSQIAARMDGKGLLVTNEIHPQRAKILAENVERMGIRNAFVTQATPPQLSARFPLTFDRIMLDAPCSGEGMFRKDPDATKEWSQSSVDFCAARQREILHDAIAMLKPGGTIAYSTCTFNRKENEENVEFIVNTYPFMELICERRVWPHIEFGEGHYVAILRRQGENGTFEDEKNFASIPSKQSKKSASRTRKGNDLNDTNSKEFHTWAKEYLNDFVLDGNFLAFGDALYLLPPSGSIDLSEKMQGLKTPRPGLRLGISKKGRFEPDHALAMALLPREARQTWSIPADSADAAAYFRGETLSISNEHKGWTLVVIDGLPVGWGKASEGILKNHLPKGLRVNRS